MCRSPAWPLHRAAKFEDFAGNLRVWELLFVVISFVVVVVARSRSLLGPTAAVATVQ